MFDLFRSLRRGRRRPVALFVALALAVAVTACDGGGPPSNPPYWLPGSTVEATVHGPLVRIAWDAPEGGDPVAAYQINLNAYNGTGVALVSASVRDCYITGLAASTTYTVYVTARDAGNNWSGPLSGTKGNRKTTVTTASNGGAGPNLWCHASTDTDGDGLPDAFETDDGSYTSAADAGTDPANPDTDNDGISDGTETLGRPGLNLIGMGARPTHKNVMIETDWIDGASCSLQPTATRLAPMIAAFANAPTAKVTNPDGTQGIKVIVDYGQGGHFTGGNQVPDLGGPVDGTFIGGVSGSNFLTTNAAHFDPVREDIFHYSITHSGAGSESPWIGKDTYVGVGCDFPEPVNYAAHLMHELGHSFGLGHGGGEYIPGNGPEGNGNVICDGPPITGCFPKEHVPMKPNYVSIMNTAYVGYVNDSCSFHRTPPYRLDFSDGSRATLDETAVNETIGICNGVPADFNLNGVIDPAPYRGDINRDGLITLLHDHDDWLFINDIGLTYIAS